MDAVNIGGKWVGPGQPTFLVGEIGINHNGDLAIAKQLIDLAVSFGFDDGGPADGERLIRC